MIPHMTTHGAKLQNLKFFPYPLITQTGTGSGDLDIQI